MNKKTQQEALRLARITLEGYLTRGKLPEVSVTNKELLKPLGVFVTLRLEEQLRGCIGCFEPDEPLYKVIQKMAVEAATADPRFLPVTVEELKDINIEISVMTPKRKINRWQEVELGKHGVVIKKGFRSGIFLPQVATETGWNREEFLAELCAQKAGLPADCYRDPETEIYVFEAEVFAEK